MRTFLFGLTGLTLLVTKSMFLPFDHAAVNHPEQQKPVPNTIETGYLTSGAWIMCAATVKKPCDTDYDGVRTTDVYSELPACSKDDILQFHPNGKAVFTRNLTCDATERPVETYRWELDRTMTIKLYANTIAAPMTIISLNKDFMVVTMPFDEPGGNPVITVTYKRPEVERLARS